MKKVLHTGDQGDKVSRTKELIKMIHDALENVHPNWRDCDTCSSPMGYLLKEDLFSSSSINFGYVSGRIRVVMRHLKSYPDIYKKISEKFLEIFHR